MSDKKCTRHRRDIRESKALEQLDREYEALQVSFAAAVVAYEDALRPEAEIPPPEPEKDK